MNPWLKVRSLLKKSIQYRGTIILFRQCSSKQGLNLNGKTIECNDSTEKKIEDFFFNPKVQSILRKITGIDYEKIFKPAQQELSTTVYEFVTEKKLHQLQESAHLKAMKKLQMPPIMSIRKPCEEILSKDTELQGYLKNPLVFTDTSQEISCRDRMITIRELDGTLRTANWEERFRMNQIFFPIPGRNLLLPKLFESSQIDKLLDDESYLFVLDIACVQFEPDDPLYHKVISATFEHISKRQKFHELKSTRHFGPMAFYFAWENHIEPLLLDMIERQMINDAADTIKLLHIIHPDVEKSLNLNSANDTELVQAFIKNNSTDLNGRLELAFDSFMEIQGNQTEINPEELSKSLSVH